MGNDNHTRQVNHFQMRMIHNLTSDEIIDDEVVIMNLKVIDNDT